MKQLKRVAAVVAACAFTIGFSGGQFASAQDADTDAELEAGAGVNCVLTVLPSAAIDFGLFTFDQADGEYQSAPDTTTSTVTFTLALFTYEPNINCEVTSYGTDLKILPADTAGIPISHVTFVDGANSPLDASLPAWTTLYDLPTTPFAVSGSVGAQNTLISSTADPIASGTGAVVIDTTLTLSGTDHALPPGLYDGSITFTSTDETP